MFIYSELIPYPSEQDKSVILERTALCQSVDRSEGSFGTTRDGQCIVPTELTSLSPSVVQNNRPSYLKMGFYFAGKRIMHSPHRKDPLSRYTESPIEVCIPTPLVWGKGDA